MKRSRRELSIDIVIHRGIFKITKLRSCPALPLCLKQGLICAALKAPSQSYDACTETWYTFFFVSPLG